MRLSPPRLQSLERYLHRSHTVGFIGLGQMGHAMADNWFSKRFAETANSSNPGSKCFVVCDVDIPRAQAFAKAFTNTYPGAKISVAETPADVAVAAQTVLTMLPSSPQVLEAYKGPSGILQALRTLPKNVTTSSLCIDSTTLDVDVAKAVASEMQSTGAEMIDAPVSGGVTGAKAGTLSFLVGGPAPAFERASPILAHMGSRIIHCGASGAGLASKICNNLILGVQQIVVAEAMLIGQRLGLDPAVLAGVINSSTGGCWSSSVNNPVPGALPDKSPPCERDYEGGFQTALMLKDMGLATNIALTTGTSTPMAEAAQRIYAHVMQHHKDLATKDFSSVYKYLLRTAKKGTSA